MRKIGVIFSVLILTFSTAYGVTYTKGKKGRKYVRRFSLRENLTGDKLIAYNTYGYTPHRLRIRGAGKVIERWRYHSRGLELTFDEEGRLVSTRHFVKTKGHID